LLVLVPAAACFPRQSMSVIPANVPCGKSGFPAVMLCRMSNKIGFDRQLPANLESLAGHHSRSHQLCSHSTTPSILWNRKVNYHIHKSSRIVPVLSQTIQVSTSILSLSTHLYLGLPSGLFPTSNLYVLLLPLPSFQCLFF
jgi:hypothetical protein